jgi:pimeloyl-ACP methyl ester carboxylesterase
MKTRRLNMLFTWAALALFACMPAFSQNSEEDSKADSVVCRSFASIPVALAPGQPARYSVSGELCATEDELAAGTTVQLLIHGAAYNHDYWDFGTVNGIRYSYARDVAAHGFPAFALDLIGAGNSSHPPSDQVTNEATAYVAHQIVQGLRTGSVNGAPLGLRVPFSKVIIVGHSLGSVTVWQEAISYHDVDGVIVTGAAHAVTTQFLTANALYPAVLDPKFVNSGLDRGYLTTIPGTRAVLYFSSPDVDPAVLAADEAKKDVVAAADLTTGLPVVTSSATLAINVPVLDIVGSNDFTTCGLSSQGVIFDCSSGTKVATQDAPFYSPAARLHACVIPGSGHSVNLAVNHRLAAADAVAWSLAFVGPRSSKDIQTFEGSDRALPWNDELPWNCGTIQQTLN